jgi:arylsulfatase A-like enzyme
VFKTAGFATAGYLANGYVSVKWGFKQGFDTYKNYIRDEQPAATAHLLKDALPWVERNKGERMFMYLATVDPHVNYRWRDAYSLQYDPEPYRGPVERSISGHFLNRILEKKVTLGERDKQRVIATYDGEVSYNDAQLGKLLEHLSALGILDETAILITADHGEEFWDHGGVGHGRSLYQELISVPFILWRPGALPEGRVVEGDVEIVDVMATLLSLAGLEAGPAVQGSDLLPVARGEVPDLPTPAFASHGSMSRSLKMGRWKYILRGGDNDDLFDLSADPTEQKDVKVDHPIAHRWARDVMAFWLSYNERWSKRTWGVPSNHAAGLVESL